MEKVGKKGVKSSLGIVSVESLGSIMLEE